MEKNGVHIINLEETISAFNKAVNFIQGIVKKNGEIELNQIIDPKKRSACSFERIYFSRGNDIEIYNENK